MLLSRIVRPRLADGTPLASLPFRFGIPPGDTGQRITYNVRAAGGPGNNESTRIPAAIPRLKISVKPGFLGSRSMKLLPNDRARFRARSEPRASARADSPVPENPPSGETGGLSASVRARADSPAPQPPPSVRRVAFLRARSYRAGGAEPKTQCVRAGTILERAVQAWCDRINERAVFATPRKRRT